MAECFRVADWSPMTSTFQAVDRASGSEDDFPRGPTERQPLGVRYPRKTAQCGPSHLNFTLAGIVGIATAESMSQKRRDSRLAVERPLRSSLANTCLPADRAPGTPLGTQGSDSGTVHGDSRPSKLLAFGPRIPDTCTDPLGDQAALKLGDSAKHSENHLAGGRAGVHLLREGNQVTRNASVHRMH